MIAVLADDFTGAAELAGIALRYGLDVRLFTGEVNACNADVYVVASNSRSMQKTAALQATQRAIQQLQALNPQFIYKKTDSVLRGYVLDELKLQMQLTGLDKAILLPANPSLQRIISEGMYFIAGKKITETDFAHDPEFPAKGDTVEQLLQTSADEDIYVAKKYQDAMPEKGIVIGDATSTDDLKKWSSKLDKHWLLAGAGDFFEQLLKKTYTAKNTQLPVLQLPHVYVCGTTSSKAVQLINTAQPFVVYIDASIITCHTGNAINNWLQQVQTTLQAHNKVIIAFSNNIKAPPGVLRNLMAMLVKEVIKSNHIKELFIEGGATAAALLDAMQLSTYTVTDEIYRGVVRMKAGDIYVTVKPGSYALPQVIQQMYFT